MDLEEELDAVVALGDAEDEVVRLRDAVVKLEDELLRLKLIAAGLYAAREELPEWARLRVMAMVSAPSAAWATESESEGSNG